MRNLEVLFRITVWTNSVIKKYFIRLRFRCLETSISALIFTSFRMVCQNSVMSHCKILNLFITNWPFCSRSFCEANMLLAWKSFKVRQESAILVICNTCKLI